MDTPAIRHRHHELHSPSSSVRLAIYALAAGFLALALGRAVTSRWMIVDGITRVMVFAGVVAAVSVLAGIAFDPLRSGLRRAAHRLHRDL